MSIPFIVIISMLGYIQIGLTCLLVSNCKMDIGLECDGDASCVLCKIAHYALTWPRWVG